MKIYSEEARKYFKNLLGYKFKDWGLMVLAFTRSSFDKEFVEDIDTKERYRVVEGNENLEFYGDKALYGVIGYILSILNPPIPYKQDFFDNPQHPYTEYETPNGETVLEELDEMMTDDEKRSIENHFITNPELLTYISESISNNSNLASSINNCYIDKEKKISIKTMMLMGGNDIANNVINKEKVMADLFEAIIGAVAVDCKFNITTLSLAVIRLLKNNKFWKAKFTPSANNHPMFNFELFTKDNCIEMMNLHYQKHICNKPIYSLLSEDGSSGRTILKIQCDITAYGSKVEKTEKGIISINKKVILGSGIGQGFNLKQAKREACWNAIINLQNDSSHADNYEDKKIEETESDIKKEQSITEKEEANLKEELIDTIKKYSKK